MDDIVKQIGLLGLVPVIQLNEPEKAVPLAKALMAGGLPIAEVTFRAAGAASAIGAIAEHMPQVLVGAGTVLSPQQAEEAIAAGARFVVSPGLNPQVVTRCLEKGVAVIPGCASPSDMEAAMALGLSTVKFFPAEQAGGLPYLKAVSGPYPGLHFMATGGIGLHNLGAYLNCPAVCACGGSWMVKPEAVAACDWASISRLCRQAVDSMLAFRLHHIGLHCSGEAEAGEFTSHFGNLFGLLPSHATGSGPSCEMLACMKKGRPGSQGHIAIGTPSLARAVYHLKLRGADIDEGSRTVDETGHSSAICLQGEYAGFALQLVEDKKE